MKAVLVFCSWFPSWRDIRTQWKVINIACNIISALWIDQLMVSVPTWCWLCVTVIVRVALCPECLRRPGVLGGNMGNYPWLADSWPTSNLVHSGKEAVNCCAASHDTTERYYNGMFAAVASSPQPRNTFG